MKGIETSIVVDDAHRATIELAADIPLGTHRVVLIIDGSAEGQHPWEGCPVHHMPRTVDFSPRPADLYGGEGC